MINRSLPITVCFLIATIVVATPPGPGPSVGLGVPVVGPLVVPSVGPYKYEL